MSNEISTIDSFKQELFKNHYNTLVNFMKNEDNAKKFMSAVVYSVQKTPKLLECKRESLMNAFMTCAELGMYPSSASWECYILPYEKKKQVWTNWITERIDAQFQLWYQWLITLFYRSWLQAIRSEIIRENDKFEYINWQVKHTVDIFKSQKERWKPMWAYVIATINNQEIAKAMNADDILKFKTFSKSASSSYSPWNETKDPELWMWKKTVIKQLAKLLPKNETISKAVEIDNQDSIINDEKLLNKTTDDLLDGSLWGFTAEPWEAKLIS